jgi:hypothetical protein
MIADMRKAYEDAGGAPVSIVIGKILGMILRTATQTVVVVIVLRLMGAI